MRRIGAFAAFLTLLAAAGCTSADGSGPSTAPLSTPTTSVLIAPPPSSSVASSSPVPTVPPDVPRTGPNTKPGEQPPVMPVAATQHTADGAEAFAEFFVRTIDWGYATTSGAYIRDYALPNCSGCSAYANEFDADRRAGHRYSGGRISTTQVAMAGTPLVRGAEDTALVSFNIESFEELDKKGGFVTADGAHSGARYEVSLKWAADGWRVVQVALEQ